MASITTIANDFFAACEAGKGWEVSARLTVLQTRPSPHRPNRLQVVIMPCASALSAVLFALA